MQESDCHARPTHTSEFRFYQELNDFLPPHHRHRSFRVAFAGRPSVKDTIQAIGVPHSAVDLVLVDGSSVDFSRRLRGGERVAVYPEFERLDISPLLRLRPRPLRETRFVLDVHLGRLAHYLRMLGFDSAYANDWGDNEIIRRSLAEKRIILTRDLGILKQNRVTHGYWLRHQRPLEQARELIEALDLSGQVRPFTRCMECNGPIANVPKSAVRGLVRPGIFDRYGEFRQCAGCRRVYWRGSHFDRMSRLVDSLRKKSG